MKKQFKKSVFRGFFIAAMVFFNTNANAQSSPVDTLVNATGGTMRFTTEERIGGIDSGESALREVFIYLSSDTSGFSIPVKTTWEKKNGVKLDTVTMLQPGNFWVRIKMTDTANSSYTWSRMKPIVVIPVAKKGTIQWVSKPQNLNDTVSMQFAYKSNVDGKIKIYKGLTSGQLYLSKVINVKADTIGKSLFDFYKVPSGIITWYRIDFENSAGTDSSSTEKATAAPSKRTPIVGVDSVWNDGTTLKIKGYVNAFGSKTDVWIRYGLKSSDTNTSFKVSFEGYANQKFSISIPNMNWGDKIYYEAKAENTIGTSKDIQGYYVMPSKPATFDIVINKVEGNFGKVSVTYTVYLAPASTARVGLYRDNNSDMSSPEEQINLEIVYESGTVITKVFENVPSGEWHYSGWGNDSKGTIIDHGNVVMHSMQWGLSVKPITMLSENVMVSVYDAAGKFIGLYEFSSTNYKNLPAGQILFIRYVDPKGQWYAGKILVQ